jgi:hypothetical protein
MSIKGALALYILVLPVAWSGSETAPAPDSAAATAPAPAVEASIPFANRGGINDWRVIDNRTVLIQSNSRQWYKATLFAPCTGLPWAQRVGFQSNPNGSFDKFSALKLRHQTCPLISLVKTDPPTKKRKPHPPPEVTTAPAASIPPPAAPAATTPPQ